MIYAHSLCLDYGTQSIFNTISCNFTASQRVGLVGRNGSGKSTFLKAIIDPTILDSGTITLIPHKTIAYMPQDVVLLSERTIFEETCSTFKTFYALCQEINDLEKKLSLQATPSLIERYSTLQEQLASLSPEQIKAEVKKMLMGLGFSIQQFDMPVSSLSVGWKMRIVLAKLLLQKADFYLFDEPTNHLDLGTKEWFLDFLKSSSFGFILVCHERYFLDELCTNIFELEYGNGTMYKGNYSSYLSQKEHALALLSAAYIHQQKEIKRKQETIERFRASASKAKMAQSMIKSLEKIERITLPPNPKDVSFSFPPVKQAGRIVLTINKLTHAFGEKLLFSDVSTQIERGQKVALIAPNGGGKTTLFNLITGSLPMQKGSITFGHNVTTAIFDQDQNKALEGSKTILENLKHLCPTASEQTIRTFLGAFLFSADDVYKKVSVLSGGEKNRVGMVKVLLQNANLLLLDEPTNHLDIPSKEILQKALFEFQGTIFFVSHDRDFINALATHIVELTPHGAALYHGNYDAYLQQKKIVVPVPVGEKRSESNHKNSSSCLQERDKKDLFELNKKSKRLEDKITKLEQQISKAQMAFADLSYGTPAFAEQEIKLRSLQQELKTSEEQWELVQQDIFS